jgi:hypothetical protein
MEKIKQESKRNLSALSGGILIVLLSGCLKTEYPNEKPCEPPHPFQVSSDHEQNREILVLFSDPEETGLYRNFVPTHPSRVKWSFTDNLIFGEDEFPMEYSEAESLWGVKNQDSQRIGTLALLSNGCWGSWELLLKMENGERGFGTLSYGAPDL